MIKNLEFQLEEWVKGNPVHDSYLDQCCPDFSCCHGDLAPEDERLRFKKAFLDGDDYLVQNMLGIFLGRLLQKQGRDVYIAGVDDSTNANLH